MSDQVNISPALLFYWKSLLIVGLFSFLAIRSFNEEPIVAVLFGISAIFLSALIFIRKNESIFTVGDKKISLHGLLIEKYEFDLINFDKLEIRQSLLQRLLNIGNINFYDRLSKKPKVIFYGIQNPKKWKRKIDDLITDAQRESRIPKKISSKIYHLKRRFLESYKANPEEKLYKSENILHYSKPYSSFTLHCFFIEDDIGKSFAFNKAVNFIDETNDTVAKETGRPIRSRMYYSKGYLTWRGKIKNLVKSLQKVDEDQEIFEISVNISDSMIGRHLHSYKHTAIKSPSSGFIEPIKPTRELDGYFSGYIIYDSTESYRNHRFKNRFEISTDPFSLEDKFYWSSIGCPSDELIEAMKLFDKTPIVKSTIHLNNYLSFKPMNKNGIDFICFKFDYRNLNLKADDKISFLLSEKKVIEFTLPDNQEIITRKKHKVSSVILSREEMQLLSQYELIAVRVYQKSINYKYDIKIDDYIDTWTLNKENKQSIIKDLFKSHSMTVQKVVENYQPFENISDSEPYENEEDYCHVYLMIDTTNNFHKIGISGNPKYREKTLQSEKPTIELICSKEFPSRTIAENLEKTLHNSFGAKRIRGEWFELTNNDVEQIKQTLLS